MSLSDPAAAGEYLIQAAGRSEMITAVVQTENDTWAVEFEEDATCLVEWATDPVRLVLSADLGVAPEERQREVQTTALSYNALWRETGGVRIAQAGHTGEMILIRELAAETVEDTDLAAVLEHFGSITAWWGEYVTLEPDATPTSAETPFQFVMRV